MKRCAKLLLGICVSSNKLTFLTPRSLPYGRIVQPFRVYSVSKSKAVTYAPDAHSPEATIKTCDAALATNPNDVPALTTKAEALLKLKNWKLAMECATKIIAIEASNGQAFRIKATCLHNMGNIDEALKAVTTACQANDKDGKSFLLKGILLATSGNLNDALAAINSAARLDSKNAEAHYERGRILRQLKDSQAALAAFNKAISLDASHVNAYNMKAVIQHDSKDFDHALATWDEAIKIDPTSSTLLANKAKLLVRLKRFPEAAEVLRKAIQYEHDKADGGLRVVLGECLMQMSQYGEAAKVLQEATKLSPSDATAFALLGQALNHWGHIVEGLEQLTKACDMAAIPQAAWLHTRGQILHRLGKDKEAVEVLEKLVADHPESAIIANTYVLLGGVYYQGIRNNEKALAAFEAAIAKDPDLSDGYAAKAQLLDEAQNHTGALEMWSKAIELKRDADALLFTNRGKCYSLLQKFPEAESDFNSAISAKPKDAEAYKALGVCKWMQGKPDDAYIAWSKGAEQDTEDAYIHYLKAVYLQRNSKLKEALSCLDTALKIGQEQGSVPMEVEDLRFQVINALQQRPRS